MASRKNRDEAASMKKGPPFEAAFFYDGGVRTPWPPFISPAHVNLEQRHLDYSNGL